MAQQVEDRVGLHVRAGCAESIHAAVSAIRAYTSLPDKVSQVHRNTIAKCL